MDVTEPRLRSTIAAPLVARVTALGLRFVSCSTAASGFDYQGLSGKRIRIVWPGATGTLSRDWLTRDAVSGTPRMRCTWRMTVTVTRDHTLNNADPDHQPFGITLQKHDAPFAFSCLPYTPLELENATHQEELPAPRRTVLTHLRRRSRCGGIDSWGAGCRTAVSHCWGSRP